MYQADYGKAQRTVKRLVLVLMLVLACVLLSGCYTDLDRAFDNDPNLNLNQGSNFETVITNTPSVTNSPTPSPTTAPTETPQPQTTQNAADWGDFWNTTQQPDQPTNVVTSAPNSSGIINNGGSSVITQNITPTTNPQGGQTFPNQGNSGSTPIVNTGSNNGSTPIVNTGSNNGSTPIVNNGGSSSNNGGSSSNNGGSSSSNNGGSSSSNGGSSSNNGGSSSNNGGSSSSSTVLKQGSKGTEVSNLQKRLKELKYYTGSVDGDYGAGTVSAVKEFQKNNNLTADGKAGQKTLEVLYSYYAVPKTSTGSDNGGGGTSSKPSSGNSGSSSGGSSSNNGGSSSGGSSGNTNSNANSYTNGETNTYLKAGSTGAQVKIMQNRLIVLGYLSGTANGKFETTTEEAVKAFQKRHNMYADGIAGPDTLTKLYSSSARKADSVVANLGSLKENDNGAGVRALQRNLRTLGYYTGNIDGDYGPGTLAAVTAFQAANGLTADGIAGNSTQGAILVAINGGNSGSSGSGAGSGSGSGSGNNGSTSPVTYGSTATSNGYSTVSSTNGNSANITAVQSALSAKGYYSGSLDGKFGSGTQKAVEEFQRAQGLRVTGMAGPSTQRLLYGGTAASGSYKKLEKGSTGSAVKSLQYALYELKYYDGNITGSYDDATESAVMLFQDCNGLEIDGIAGQKTQQTLFSSSAKPCTK